jgi:tetratricopeptide (TPR) repeat protein
MSLDRSLLAAQGYIELDMPVEALAELDALSSEDCENEAALQMRLFILMKTQAWDEALVLCNRLREIFPEGAAGYIHGAFCLHEEGRTAEARDLLLSGPPSLEEEATYFYNLGCYSAVLGDFDAARDYVQTSFAMDSKFKEIAKLDPDLSPIKKDL